jgi:hypothetical protein
MIRQPHPFDRDRALFDPRLGRYSLANPEIYEFLEAKGMGYPASGQPRLAGQERAA